MGACRKFLSAGHSPDRKNRPKPAVINCYIMDVGYSKVMIQCIVTSYIEMLRCSVGDYFVVKKPWLVRYSSCSCR
jgi:hypothetical protein